MLQIAFGQSKYYTDNLSENVKRGQRQKLRRGEWPGWAPLGYLNDKNLRKIVIDPVKGPLAAQLKNQISQQILDLQLKLDRLLDSHLEGLVEKVEYQAKKETLLKAKVELEEKLVKLEQRATGWFEPCRQFLQSAHQAHQVAAEGNFESLKEMAKKIGSNYRLARASLHFSYNLPWGHLAGGVTFENLRRGRDLNSRSTFWMLGDLANRWFQPLTHLSEILHQQNFPLISNFYSPFSDKEQAHLKLSTFGIAMLPSFF